MSWKKTIICAKLDKRQKTHFHPFLLICVGNIIKEFGLNLSTCNWLQMLRLSYNLATGLLGRQIGWILSVNVTGLLMCSRAMSRFRFSFQLYLGWTMISSIATIFSMLRSNLEKNDIIPTGLQMKLMIIKTDTPSYWALLCFPRRTSISLMVKFLFQGG